MVRGCWLLLLVAWLSGCVSAPSPTRGGASTVEIIHYPQRPRPLPTQPESRPAPLPPSSGGNSRCERLSPLIREVAQDHELDPALLFAIVNRESGFQSKARNRSGASGLMQLMPGTARNLKCTNLLEAKPNLDCGARLLGRLLKRYEGRITYALAAYAVGARSVDAAWKAKRRPPRESFYTKIQADMKAWRTKGCAGLSKGMVR